MDRLFSNSIKREILLFASHNIELVVFVSLSLIIALPINTMFVIIPATAIAIAHSIIFFVYYFDLEKDTELYCQDTSPIFPEEIWPQVVFILYALMMLLAVKAMFDITVHPLKMVPFMVSISFIFSRTYEKKWMEFTPPLVNPNRTVEIPRRLQYIIPRLIYRYKIPDKKYHSYDSMEDLSLYEQIYVVMTLKCTDESFFTFAGKLESNSINLVRFSEEHIDGFHFANKYHLKMFLEEVYTGDKSKDLGVCKNCERKIDSYLHTEGFVSNGIKEKNHVLKKQRQRVVYRDEDKDGHEDAQSLCENCMDEFTSELLEKNIISSQELSTYML